MKRLMIAGLAVCAAAAAFAAIEITAPAAGSTVSQLHPTQAKFVHESQAEREKYFDGGKNAAALRKDGSQPKPVEIAWTGAKGACAVTVKRLPDGKVFFSGKAKDGSVKVDSLEIAREWEVTVSDGKDVAKSTFRTEDQAPRLVYVNKRIANARDVGGRIGLDGRRIRQGLVFRTVGLNGNAPTDYYSNDEIMELYRSGKLEGMGSQGKHIAHKLKKGGKLHSTPKRNRLIKREKYAPGEKRMTEEERVAILARWGFRSDIDLRTDRECFGMTGSPLGPDVTWFHYSYAAYNIGNKDCNEKVFRVFLDPKNYPIVFHCIGGADRTGTVACLLEALLGVDENNLWMDYLTTGFAGVVSDARHKECFGRVLKDLAKFPGDTWAKRAEGYFRSIGYTDGDIAFLRDFLLEK